VVAVILSVLAFLSGGETPTITNPLGGGRVHNQVEIFTNGLQNRDAVVLWEECTIKAGSNDCSIRNLTGRTLYLDYVQIRSVADAAGTHTASSTYNFYVATSSVATVAAANDYTRPGSANIKNPIDGGQIATSTVKFILTATSTTDSVSTASEVASRDYVIVNMQTGLNPACAANKCESATSTARGFDVKAFLRFHQAPN